MLAGVLRFGGANSAESPQLVAEQGYDKPEQALEAYAKAMQAGDLQGMLSTFAASNYLSHRSDYADYNTAFDEAPFWISANGMQELQVAGTPLSKAVAAEKVRSFLIDALIAQYCYPLFHENSHYVYNEEAQQYIIVTESESELQDFVKQISESAPMTDITVGTPFEVSDKLSSEAAANYQKLMASVARRRRRAGLLHPPDHRRRGLSAEHGACAVRRQVVQHQPLRVRYRLQGGLRQPQLRRSCPCRRHRRLGISEYKIQKRARHRALFLLCVKFT